MLTPLLLLALASGGDTQADAPLVVRRYDLSSVAPFHTRASTYAILFPHISRTDGDYAENGEDEGGSGLDIVQDQIQRLYGEDLLQLPGVSVRRDERQLVVRAPEAHQNGILELLQFFESVVAPTTTLAVDVVTLPAAPATPIPSVLGAAEAEKLVAGLAQNGKRTSAQLELRPGATGALDLTSSQQLVLDYDCEIAQSAAILDPVVEVVRTGLRLHVRCAPAPGGTWLALMLRSTEPTGPVQELELGYRSMIVAQERDLGDLLAAHIQSITLENRSMALNTFLGEGKALVIQTAIELQDRKGCAVFVLRSMSKPLPRELRFTPAGGGPERGIHALAWPFAVPPCCRLASEDYLFSTSRDSLNPDAFSIDGNQSAFVAGFEQPPPDALFELLRAEDPGRIVHDWGPWVFLGREPGYDPPTIAFEAPEVILARMSPSPRLFQLAFTLKRAGSAGTVVARLVAPVRASEPFMAVLGTEQNRVFDYNVEVAQNCSVADPRVYDALDGLAVLARPGTTMRGEMTLNVRAKARIQRGATREFHQGSQQLGSLAQSSSDVLVVDERFVFAKEGGTRTIPLGEPAGSPSPGALVLEVEMTEVR